MLKSKSVPMGLISPFSLRAGRQRKPKRGFNSDAKFGSMACARCRPTDKRRSKYQRSTKSTCRHRVCRSSGGHAWVADMERVRIHVFPHLCLLECVCYASFGLCTYFCSALRSLSLFMSVSFSRMLAACGRMDGHTQTHTNTRARTRMRALRRTTPGMEAVARD